MDETEQHFLSVGTEVSAKYRGAFCEAKIKSVKKSVVFRVTNKKDGKLYSITEESIKGSYKIGSLVEAQFPEQNSWTEGVIQSARDKSVYTVEFDDGDVRTLQRGSLCLQGVRHFAESETLDHLPLTDPENFGTPVLTKRKQKRKTPQSTSTNGDEDHDSDNQKVAEKEPSAKRKLVPGGRHTSKDEDKGDESEEEKRKKWLSDPLMGKLVLVEPADKRKHWYPAVCVNPLAYEDHGELSASQIVVRSFKNGRLLAVERCPRLTKQNAPSKVELSWKDVLESAFSWEETRMIPDVWRTDIKDILEDEEEEENDKDSEKITPSAEDQEKNHEFLEQLYKFMEDRGTPVNKTPVLGYKDLDLFLLYRLVQDKGGFHAVLNAPDWREIYSDLGIPKVSQAAGHHAKNAYVKYLLSFEEYLMSFKQSNQKEPSKKPKKGEATKKKGRNLSGRVSPLGKSDDDQEIGKRRSRRRKISETVNDESELITPLKETKRGRRSKLDDSKRDSDMDDASSTASSEKSTTRSRVSSSNESVTQKAAPKPDRRRSNSGVRRKGAVYKAGDKIRVKYGKDSFKLYIAKVVDVDFDDGPDVQYYVHYTGWNSRHDEWIKAWQIEGYLTERDAVTPNTSPAPGRMPGRRPKTPTPGEVNEKKHTPSPPVSSAACTSVAREDVKGISQALNFNTPPKPVQIKEEPSAQMVSPPKQETTPAPSAGGKKPGKGRTRRQSMSSSGSQPDAALPAVKRAASEEKMLSKGSVKTEPIAEKEDVPKSDKPAGRITPPSALTAAARRMSSRRSKSPAYLKDFGETKRKRTTSSTSITDSPAAGSVKEDSGRLADAPETSISPADRVSTPTPMSETAKAEPKEPEDSPEDLPQPSPQDKPSEKQPTEPEDTTKLNESKVSSSCQAAYDNFDDEAPVIALEKPKPHSPAGASEPKNNDTLSTLHSDEVAETNLSDVPALENESCQSEAPAPSVSNADSKPTSPMPNDSSATEIACSEPEKQPMQSEELPSTDSNASDESSSSENNERPSDDAPESVAEPQYRHPPMLPPQPQQAQIAPPPLPQGAPSSSKVLVENTPPTTPEASPDHFYDDLNGDSDNAGIAGSGASSLSGDVPVSSSSPDYPPKDETCPGVKGAPGSEGESAPKRKCRKGQGHRRSSSKNDSRKRRKSAAGESETDDDAPSSGKANEGTPSKGRRRMNKRRAKSKPEPPSAPPPVIGEELAKMNPDERIRVLQAKLAEMRKVYQQLKQEVSSIDRKRKRAKRKEQEAAEIASPTLPKKHCPSSPGKRDNDDAATDKGDIEADIAAAQITA